MRKALLCSEIWSLITTCTAQPTLIALIPNCTCPTLHLIMGVEGTAWALGFGRPLLGPQRGRLIGVCNTGSFVYAGWYISHPDPKAMRVGWRVLPSLKILWRNVSTTQQGWRDGVLTSFKIPVFFVTNAHM